MTIRKSILILSNTGTSWNVIGEPVQANAFYGYTSGLCTVQIVTQNLVGQFGIQATLALKPEPEDWFFIQLNPTGNSVGPYFNFPVNELAPTGQNGGDTGSMAFTFLGNFTYLRAVLNRDYIQPPPPPMSIAWNQWVWGQIDNVRLSL